MRYPRRHQPAGFSLLELLVVIALIGALAAFFVPQYQSYRNTQTSKVERAVANLPNSVGKLVGPESIPFGQSVSVKFELSGLRMSAKKNQAQAAGGAQIPTAEQMKVTLVGSDGLKVTSVSNTEQFVNYAKPTAWTWQVAGEKAGAEMLTLRVSALVPQGKTLIESEVHVSSVQVNVSVSTVSAIISWINANSTLVGGMLGGIGAIIVWAHSQRRKASA